MATSKKDWAARAEIKQLLGLMPEPIIIKNHVETINQMFKEMYIDQLKDIAITPFWGDPPKRAAKKRVPLARRKKK